MSQTTVLVIEDNPSVRKLLRVTLQAEGYRVLEAEDSRSAIEQISQHEVALVIQDLVLPDGHGLDLVGRLRAVPGREDVPIVAFTGALTEADRDRICSAGFDDFLVKPVSTSRLVEFMRKFLASSPAAATGSASRPRVVLVEDDSVLARVGRHQLERMGYSVQAYLEPGQALRETRRAPPAAVVTDVLLPSLEGFDFCFRIRTDPDLAGVPVVMLSTFDFGEEGREIATRMGASALVARSSELRDLDEAIRKAIDAPPPPVQTRAAERPASQMARILRQIERQTLMQKELLTRYSSFSPASSALQRMSDSLARTRRLDDALKDFLESFVESSSLSRGALFLQGSDGKLHLAATVGFPPQEATALNDFYGHAPLLAHCLELGDPMLGSLDKAGTLPPELLRRLNAKALLVGPLRWEDETLGVVCAVSPDAPFPGEDLGILRSGLSQLSQSVVLARTMERLAGSEERFRAVFDQASDGVFILSEEGHIQEANSQGIAILGTSSEELLGRHFCEFSPPELEELHDDALREGSRVGRVRLPDTRVKRVDGSETWVDLSAALVRVGAEKFLLASLRDMSDRKQRESELSERLCIAELAADVNMTLTRQAPLPGMLNSCVEAVVRHLNAAFARVWTIDPDGKTLELQASAGMYTHLDGPHSRVAVGDLKIGKIAQDRAPHLTNTVLEDEWVSDKEWARREGMVAFAGYPLVVGDTLLGVLAMFSRRATTAFAHRALSALADGIALGIHRTLTEKALRESEAQLRQSQKMEAVGRFAGGVAHDFNNMLTVIDGYTGFILEALGPASPIREDAEVIQKTTRRAAALTRQLLAFSRRQVLQPRVVDLHEIAIDLNKMLRRLIGEDVEMAIHSEPGLWPVMADPGQMEQILMNLAVNARDAMPGGGRLTVDTSNVTLAEDPADPTAGPGPGRYVRWSVSDTGSGMNDQVKARIFEPFFTTKEKGKGTGLGLATVYGIVKQSGGWIGLDSELGKGTTFHIYLPATSEESDVVREVELAPVTSGVETVLLVEDEAGVLDLAQRILRHRGYVVLAAGAPETALEICATHPGEIHLMLTDVVMPGMSGAELAEKACAMRPDMRVLFMSGYSDDHISHHGVLDPGKELLHKPFNPQGLLAKVQRVLGKGLPGADAGEPGSEDA